MAYIEVDVDLDEFDTDDIIDELKSRMKLTGRKAVSDSKIKEIVKTAQQVLVELKREEEVVLPSNTINDKLKMEHLERVWDKYTAAQIEQLLP